MFESAPSGLRNRGKSRPRAPRGRDQGRTDVGRKGSRTLKNPVQNGYAPYAFLRKVFAHSWEKFRKTQVPHQCSYSLANGLQLKPFQLSCCCKPIHCDGLEVAAYDKEQTDRRALQGEVESRQWVNSLDD